jgi:hypothetical protein
MQDLEIAKNQLNDNHLTLVIAKNGQVLFRTDSHRLSGFIDALEKLGTDLKGASVADRVAGKALALLCIYSGILEVYAEVLSREAKAIFEKNSTVVEWTQLVDNVLDSNKTGVCPFEKAATTISDPKVSYVVFKALLEKMKPCK